MKQYLLLTIFFTSFVNAQTTFNKRYGSGYFEAGYSISVTNDDGFAVVGNTLANGADGNIFFMKLSQDGTLQWQKDIFSVNHDDAYSVYQRSNGNYIIGGKTYSYGSGCDDAFISTLDSLGNMVWAKAYGDVECQHPAAFTLADDGIVGCGVSDGTSNNGWLYKTDFNGNLLWSREYLYTGGFFSVKQTTDKGFIAIGSSSSITILKTDSIGQPIWFHTYSSLPGNTTGNDVELLKDGSAVVTGMLYLNAFGNIADVFLLKIDPNGNTVWFKTYGFTFEEYGKSVKATKEGGFIIAGYTNSFGHGEWDACLIKANSNGDLVWAKTYGDVWKDQALQVQTIKNGDLVFVGNSSSSDDPWGNDSSYVYVVRTDSNGISSCHYQDWFPLQQVQAYTPTVQAVTVNSFGTDSSCNVTTSNYLFTQRDFCAMPTNIQSTQDEKLVSIYPNPASNEIHVANIPRRTSITITNLLGQALFQATSESESLTIDVSALPNGFYFLNRHKFIKGR